MSHLDEGALHALIDGEASGAEAALAAEHLATCLSCRVRLEEARAFRGEALAMLEELDAEEQAAAGGQLMSPAWRVREPGVAATALGAAPPADPEPAPAAETHRPRGRRTGVAVAWAASVLVAAGAGYLARDASRIELGSGPETVVTTIARGDSAPTADRGSGETSVEVGQERARNLVLADTGSPASARSRQPARSRRAETMADTRPAETAPGPPPARLQLESTETAEKSADRAPAAKRESTAPAEERPAARDQAAPAAAPPAAALRGLLRTARTPPAAATRFRLIEGLTVTAIEAEGSRMRVVYETPYGQLVLLQWTEADTVATSLIAPASAPPDSVSAWERRMR